MKTRLIVSLAFFLLAAMIVVDAFAQEAPSSPAPPEKAAPAAAVPAPVGPPRYYLEVDANDLDVLSKAIADLPFKVANPLLLKLNGQLQVQDQMKAAADKVITDATEKAKKRK